MNVKCPKCGQAVDATGRAPGARLTCASCGNTTTVPVRGGGSRKTPWLAIVLGGFALMVPCMGILAAIAIPNFIRFQSRAKQAECKVNLKAWYMGQRAYANQEGGFSVAVDRVGFAPERGNRYAYFAGPGPIETRTGPDARHGEDAVGFGVDTFRFKDARPVTLEQLPPDVARLAGLSGSQCPEGPDCVATMVCAGDIDRDDTLDVWSVSTVDRTGPDGERYMAGEPIHLVDDLRD